MPVVAQQRDALAAASSASGSRLARTGSVAADTAPYQQLKASNGRVDLRTVREHAAARGRDGQLALGSAQRTLRASGSPWLLAPVAPTR